MNTTIVEANRFGVCAHEKLTAFENDLGTTLPEAYRRHLLQYNGGYVDGAKDIAELHHVYGLHEGPHWARLPNRSKIHDSPIPDHLLPIADDPFGNQICLVLSGLDRGAIRIWDHECDGDPASNSSPLAPDFDQYFRAVAVKVAIHRKNTGEVREILEELGPNLTVYSGKSIAVLIVEAGNQDLFKLLADTETSFGPDALIEAVRGGSMEILDALLSHELDVNHAIPETGFTALMLAASLDRPNLVALLLQHGANPAPRNKWGKAAIDLARTPTMRNMLLDYKT